MRCACTHRSSAFSSGRISGNYFAGNNAECTFHTENERVITLFKRRTFYIWALKLSVQASFTITKGAGSFSISPSLVFRAIVPVDSPVFSLLMDAEKELESQAVGATIENIHRKVFELYREGKASYMDTLPNGDTILHVSGIHFY